MDTSGKKWCVYTHGFPDHGTIGLVNEEYASGYEVIYDEGQLYRPESWSRDYVEVFDNLADAARYLACFGISIEDTLGIAKKKFPTRYVEYLEEAFLQLINHIPVGKLVQGFIDQMEPSEFKELRYEPSVKKCLVPIGTCSICGQIQYETPAGPSCENGHGGAPSVEDVE